MSLNGSTIVRRAWLLLVLISLAFPVIGCRNRAANGEMREVTDEIGNKLTVPQKIERFVSLDPSITEIVFAIGANDRLVGDTTYCNYPEGAKQIAKVGDTLQPNIEAIVASRAQVVLVSTSSQLESFVKKMNAQNIAVFVTNPHDLESIYQSIINLGDLLDRRSQADRVVEGMRKRTVAVETKLAGKPPVRVFYQLSREPLYTAGKTAFVTDLIRRAGGDSVTAEVPGAFPTYSAEAALAAKPDAIIMTTGDSMGGQINAEVADALKQSPAVLNNRVYQINGDLLSRPGPRVVDGLEQMAKALHPDLF